MLIEGGLRNESSPWVMEASPSMESDLLAAPALEAASEASASLKDAPTDQLEAWSQKEFERGFRDGYDDLVYRPTSLSYVRGYENGKLSAIRFGHSPKSPGSE
jgi:hypothetical protein